MNIRKVARIAADGIMMFDSIESAANDYMIDEALIMRAIKNKEKFDGAYWACKATYKMLLHVITKNDKQLAEDMEFIYWNDIALLKPYQKRTINELFVSEHHDEEWAKLVSNLTEADILGLLDTSKCSSDTEKALKELTILLQNLPFYIADASHYYNARLRYISQKGKYAYINKEFNKANLLYFGFIDRIVIFNNIVEASYYTLMPISEIKNSKDFVAYDTVK